VAAELPRSALAALEIHGKWHIDALPDARERARCPYLLVAESRRHLAETPPGWTLVAHLHRPSERDESTAVFRHGAAPAGAASAAR
jgi:hypothetical protein